MMDIERLKKSRKERFSTAQALADAVGVNRVTVTNWENGKADPSLEKLKDIASALGVTVAYLMGESDIPVPIVPGEFSLAPYAALLDRVRSDIRKMSPEQRANAFVLVFSAVSILGDGRYTTISDWRLSIDIGAIDRSNPYEPNDTYEFKTMPFDNILETVLKDKHVATAENVEEGVEILKKVMRELAAPIR